jgi:flagellar biosynthesis protein FlhG
VYYLWANELHEGPYSLEELREMALRGTFTAKSEVWHPLDGKWQWVTANRIPEFIAMFHAIEYEAIRAAEAEAREIREKASQSTHRPTTTIAVGGGKGGVGKTALTASLGLCLASLGHSVILVDCDLGGANLGPALGLPDTPKSSLDFFIKHQANVQDLLTPTGVDGLQLISGQAGVLGLANPKYPQKLKFINQLKKLEADFVLLDLGAGLMYDILDFFLSCDRGILVTCPTPLSVKYTFGFLKAATYRSISKTCLDDLVVRQGLKNMAARGFKPTMFQFLAEIESESASSAETVRRCLNERSRALVLNMVMQRGELADAARLVSDASRKLGVTMDFLGYLSFDAAVRHSVRRLIPFVADAPKSKASRELLKMVVEKILPLRGAKNREDRALYQEATRKLKGYGDRLAHGQTRVNVTPSIESWAARPE